MSRIDKLRDAKQEWGMDAENRECFSVGTGHLSGIMQYSKMDCDDYTTVNILKNTDLYALNG